MISRFVWLSVAGAAGTLARVALSAWIQRSHSTPAPLGTAVVNVLGCALFGLVVTLFEAPLFAGASEQQLSEWRLIVLSGFLGGFTTFSAYTFETLRLLERGQSVLAFANLGLQNALGLLGLWAGLQLGRTS